LALLDAANGGAAHATRLACAVIHMGFELKVPLLAIGI
jgi:hypothetical protein